jgi:hypothetical protein
MRGVDASWIIALVKDVHTKRDRALSQFIGKTMGKGAPTIYGKGAISVLVSGPLPLPAFPLLGIIKAVG